MFVKTLLAIFFFGVVLAGDSSAFYINEILADPPPGLIGDSNGDGISSSTDDEFVELCNPGTTAVDISGWSLADALRVRHVFPAATVLEPQGLLVVFGGGAPLSTEFNWQVASTGTLSLNNTSETLTLFDALNQRIEEVIYGSEAGFDQAIVRSPEGIGEIFVKHTALPNAKDILFSPGYLINPPDSSPVVPELPTLVQLLSAATLLPWLKKA